MRTKSTVAFGGNGCCSASTKPLPLLTHSSALKSVDSCRVKRWWSGSRMSTSPDLRMSAAVTGPAFLADTLSFVSSR